ncbi:MAG: GNAT family N-acetyltransferase [Bacilli bacterium]|nr:GNAT family N-acetyltransferase [Bacilli bacterium]
MEEKLFLEVPTIERKNDAIDFIKEFFKYDSDIHGSGSLRRYVDDYEGWLLKLEKDYANPVSEEIVPARTYFLVRNTDNKIIGMNNIRLALNKKLEEHGGHIGYSIRPTERGKGYNNLNLYLALKICDKYGIETAMLSADIDNQASWKTMEQLGGVRIKEFYEDNDLLVVYIIDVKNALKKHSDYEALIINK